MRISAASSSVRALESPIRLVGSPINRDSPVL
ncbi:UNVERIFIED_ORG: hypothetical protein M2179_004606 [Bradyrhizobium japonicum]